MWPWGDLIELRSSHPLDVHIAKPSQIQRNLGEFEPCRGAGRGYLIQAVRAGIYDLLDSAREIGGVSWNRSLIRDSLYVGAFARVLDDATAKILPARAEQPRSANDVETLGFFSHREFAGELGTSVNADWQRLVFLSV